MKYQHLLLFALLLFTSCEKEPDCSTCVLVEESNRDQLDRMCGGYANSYPEYDQISSETFLNLCTEAEKLAITSQATETTGTNCGFVWTRRIRVSCD